MIPTVLLIFSVYPGSYISTSSCISRGGFKGGYTPLLALVNRGARGVQKNQIQKYGTISKAFPFLKSN